MNSNTLLYGLLVPVTVALAGCVPPGEFDQGILNRYQEAMVQRAPQHRLAGQGMGLLEPAPGATGPKLKIVTDKSGKSTVYLTLDEAIMRAVANSLDIQVVAFQPAISREQTIEAAAQFDYVVFGATNFSKQDTPLFNNFFNQFLGGGQVRTVEYQAGLKQNLITGGNWQIAGTMTRTFDDPESVLPNPNWQAQTVLQLTQPLLRNAGPEFTLANLHVAQLNYKNSVSQFRQKVEETVDNVITAYWALMQAREALAIQQELLDKTVETFRRTKERLNIDATMVEVKQAEAAVETRRAVLIRTNKNIQDAQDQLARLMADAQFNLLAKYEIIPATPPNKVPLSIDTADQLALALVHSPLLEQARLAIAAADINVKVAWNQTLPKLDLQAATTVTGLDRNAGESVDNWGTFNFVGYNLGLSLEYPLGNRAAEAELRRQKFGRLQAITTMQNTADQVAVSVNERVRQINTTYQEIQAQDLAVKASMAQLQALQDTEEIRGKLTPEFLQVKLQAQSTLADAQNAQLQAIVGYNTAMADLAKVTGTMLMQHGIEVLKMPVVTGQSPWRMQEGSPATRVVTTTIPATESTTAP